MKLLRHLFLTNRFFFGMSAVILVMMLSYALPILLQHLSLRLDAN